MVGILVLTFSGVLASVRNHGLVVEWVLASGLVPAVVLAEFRFVEVAGWNARSVSVKFCVGGAPLI